VEKTIVAAIALFAAANANFQSALMVPTEILAEQHMESLSELFDPLEVRIAIVDRLNKNKRAASYFRRVKKRRLGCCHRNPRFDSKGCVFSRLGLVITDEQHRFGVNQRKILRDKGKEPDVLFMTATPIQEH